MVGSAPQRLVDFGFNPSDDKIGSPAVASGGKRYPRLYPDPGGVGFGHSGVLTAHVREESWGMLGVLGVAFPGLSKWISVKYRVFPVVKM